MALIAKRNCPHCRTQNVAFTATHEWASGDGRRAIFTCGACAEGVIWEYVGVNSVINVAGDLDRSNAILGRQWPVPREGTAPEDTPPTVARYFEQGTSSLEAGHFDAAGLMFRKTLETATKILDGSLSGENLVKRIWSLASNGKLTADMATWAHEVRLGGNEAAHDDEPYTRDDAESLRNFIENFLRYAFTLPSAVRRRAQPMAVEAS
jgi:hypothetical protein